MLLSSIPNSTYFLATFILSILGLHNIKTIPMCISVVDTCHVNVLKVCITLVLVIFTLMVVFHNEYSKCIIMAHFLKNPVSR